jgi:hypothetical protein
VGKEGKPSSEPLTSPLFLWAKVCVTNANFITHPFSSRVFYITCKLPTEIGEISTVIHKFSPPWG